MMSGSAYWIVALKSRYSHILMLLGAILAFMPIIAVDYLLDAYVRVKERDLIQQTVNAITAQIETGVDDRSPRCGACWPTAPRSARRPSSPMCSMRSNAGLNLQAGAGRERRWRSILRRLRAASGLFAAVADACPCPATPRPSPWSSSATGHAGAQGHPGFGADPAGFGVHAAAGAEPGGAGQRARSRRRWLRIVADQWHADPVGGRCRPRSTGATSNTDYHSGAGLCRRIAAAGRGGGALRHGAGRLCRSRRGLYRHRLPDERRRSWCCCCNMCGARACRPSISNAPSPAAKSSPITSR